MAINAGTAVGYLDLDTSKFKKGFSSAISDLKVFQKESATVADKTTAIGSAMTNVGKTLTTHVTAPLAGMGAAAVKVTSDFDSGMSKVIAISGATGSEIEALRDKAIEMGAKTKFSASESAEAFQYMAMAGWKTSDMLEGIDGIMSLAAASGEDLATTSDIVTDALTAFGLQASESARFADVLAAASSNSNTNVAMMGETFKYVAPVAGALGFSIEDTAVAIGLMANSGIKASQAGTSLRSLFTNLANPVGQSKQAIEELNISLTNTDGTVKPLNQVLLELRDKFDGLTDSEKTQYAAMLAGQEGMSGLLAIVNASDEDFNKLTDSINNSSGSAEEMAEKMQDNLGGAVEQLKGALESAAIVIGERLTPYIRKLAEWITSLIEKFNSLSPEMQDLVVKIGLIVTAIGPLLLIFGKLITAIGTIGTTIKNLKNTFSILSSVFKSIPALSGLVTKGFGVLSKVFTSIAGLIPKLLTGLKALWAVLAANPIGIVITIIGALIAAFIYFWNTSEEFRQFWIDLWENIKEAFSLFTEWIQEKFSQLSTFFTETFPAALSSAWSSIVNFFTVTIPQIITSVIEWFNQLPENIAYILGYVLGIIVMKVQEWLNFLTITIPQIINGVIQWFAQLPTNIANFLTNAYNSIVTWGQNTWNSFIQTCTNVFNTVVQWFSQLPGNIMNFLTNALNNVIVWGSNLVSSGINAASNFINSVINWISQLPGQFSNWLGSVLNYLWSLPGQFWNAGANMMNSLWNGLSSVVGGIIDWIYGVVNRIRSIISSAVSGFRAATSGYSYAVGIDYIPRNNYPINAHRGEMLLTQEEANEYRAYKSGGVESGVIIKDNQFVVRDDSDIEKIARELYKMIQRKRRG